MISSNVEKTHYVTRYNTLRNGARVGHSVTGQNNALLRSIGFFFQITHVTLFLTHYNMRYLHTWNPINICSPTTRNLSPNFSDPSPAQPSSTRSHPSSTAPRQPKVPPNSKTPPPSLIKGPTLNSLDRAPISPLQLRSTSDFSSTTLFYLRFHLYNSKRPPIPLWQLRLTSDSTFVVLYDDESGWEAPPTLCAAQPPSPSPDRDSTSFPISWQRLGLLPQSTLNRYPSDSSQIYFFSDY